jgi:hypothetical protein
MLILASVLLIQNQERMLTIKKTFEAAVRFNPTPPAFRDINNTYVLWKKVFVNTHLLK